MTTIYFVDSNTTMTDMRAMYRRQEAPRYRGQSIPFLADNAPAMTVRAKEVCLSDVLETCPVNSIIVLSSTAHLGISFPNFIECFRQARGKNTSIRFLEEEVTLGSGDTCHAVLHVVGAFLARTRKKPVGFGVEPITKDVVEAMRNERASGADIAGIARRHKVSPATVSKYTKGIVHCRPRISAKAAALPGYRAFKYRTPPGIRAQSPMEEALVNFLASQRTDSTRQIYYYALRGFFAFNAGRGGALYEPSNLSSQAADAYRDHQQKSGAAPRGIKTYLSVLKAFSDYCYNTGITNRNRLAGVKAPTTMPAAHVASDPFTKDEIARLLQAAQKGVHEATTDLQRMLAHRTYVAVYLLATVGMRVGALVSIKLGDIASAKGITYLTMNTKVNARKYTVSIPPHAATVISEFRKAYVSGDDASAYLFQSFRGGPWSPAKLRQEVNRLCDMAKVDKAGRLLTCQSFSVSWALFAHEGGMGPRQIQLRLNHRDLAKTMSCLKVHMQEIDDEAWIPAPSHFRHPSAKEGARVI